MLSKIIEVKSGWKKQKIKIKKVLWLCANLTRWQASNLTTYPVILMVIVAGQNQVTNVQKKKKIRIEDVII